MKDWGLDEGCPIRSRVIVLGVGFKFAKHLSWDVLLRGTTCCVKFQPNRTYRTWVRGSCLSVWSIKDCWEEGWDNFSGMNGTVWWKQKMQRVNSWDAWRRVQSKCKASPISTGARFFGSLNIVVAFVHGENSHDPANFEKNWWLMCNLRLSQWVPWFSYTHGVFFRKSKYARWAKIVSEWVLQQHVLHSAWNVLQTTKIHWTS